MARVQISFKDKQIVMQRLAQGASTREAITGTVISSNNTAARIAKEQSHEIAQLREQYLEQIEKAGAGVPDRAKLWAKMTRATKQGGDREIPDWDNRAKALKYIDSLAGIAPEGQDKRTIVVGAIFNKADYSY